jgi:DNA repair protein RadC
MVALLNSKNEIVKKAIVAMGATSECRVEPIQVFHFACKNAAQRIILIHNHPSGDTAPSSTDIELTKRLKNGGEILGITILDHVIVSKKGYSSMRDMCLL